MVEGATKSNSVLKQRARYYGFGLLVAGFCTAVYFAVDEVLFDQFLESQVGIQGNEHNAAPLSKTSVARLKMIRDTIWHVPWIMVAIVLGARVVKGRRVRAGSYVLGSLSPLALMIGWLLIAPIIDEITHTRAFDADLWAGREQSETPEDFRWPLRLCMVDDLLSKGYLDGLTQTQVLDLLGPPEDKGFPYGAVNCDIHYELGPERSWIPMDKEWLFITFNEEDVVDKVWIYTD